MKLTIREPGSAITHFVGMIMAVLAATPLLMRASSSTNRTALAAMVIFIFSMILLYGASTTYHSLTVSAPVLKIFRKIDHMMIFVLIAGSYTPLCLLVLDKKTGFTMLAIIWGLALVGMAINAIWITCPKWFSSVVYIAMGWTCIFISNQLFKTLSTTSFGWLLTGGIVYTVGGILYALKLPIFNSIHKNFGSHEIFHLFVMGGSVCHFIFMYTII